MSHTSSAIRQRAFRQILERWESGCHIVLVFFAVLPFLRGGAFALTDLAQAIGRNAVGLRLLDDPESSAFYSFKLVPVPNMALDLWSLALGRLTGVEVAVNAFVVLVIVLYYSGIQYFRRAATGKTSVIAGALSIFVITGLPLYIGFVNYMLASALMLFAMARIEIWTKVESKARSQVGFWLPQSFIIAGMLLTSIFPIILYFSYLIGRTGPEIFVSLRAGILRPLKIWIGNHGLGFALFGAMLLLGRFQPGIESAATEWRLNAKLLGLSQLVIMDKSTPEIAVGLSALVFALVLSAKLRPRIPNRFVLPLAFCALLYLVMPFYLRGVAFADVRLIQAIAAIFLSVMVVTASETKYEEIGLPTGFLMVCSLLKIGVLSQFISMQGALRTDVEEASKNVPVGSQIFVGIEKNTNLFLYSSLMPSIILLKGDYYFGSLFKNYFIRYKIEKDIYSGTLLQEILAPEQFCFGFTHVLALGSRTQMPTGLPLRLVAERQSAAVFEILQPATANYCNKGPKT